MSPNQVLHVAVAEDHPVLVLLVLPWLEFA
jgi:hypothetical protein